MYSVFDERNIDIINEKFRNRIKKINNFFFLLYNNSILILKCNFIIKCINENFQYIFLNKLNYGKICIFIMSKLVTYCVFHI